MVVRILRGFEESFDGLGVFDMTGLLGVCEKSAFDAADALDTIEVRFKNKKDIPRWYIKESKGCNRKYGYDPYLYIFYRKDLEAV